MSFTSVHDDENIGGSKTATNVQSSGDTAVNQLEPDKKNQPRDSSNSSTKRVITKSYHDAERKARMQMRHKERQQKDIKKVHAAREKKTSASV